MEEKNIHNIPVIANDFARKRHAPNSGLSYFNGTWGSLCFLVSAWLRDGLTSPGYKDGVLLVDVPQEFITSRLQNGITFISGVIKLTAHTPVLASYMARKPGEEPRKEVMARAQRAGMPAKSCQIVLYRNDVLAVDGDNCSPLTSPCWEIISINASPYLEDMPIPPTALIYNHLEMSGGTSTEMTDSEFVETLRVSMAFWKNHAMMQYTP